MSGRRRGRARITGNRPEVIVPPIDECVDLEIRSHIEFQAERLIAEGWAPEDAVAEAVRRFGNMDEVSRECRDHTRRRDRRIRLAGLLNGIPNDLRFGFRTLLRRPEVTALAVVALGLGIGACTAIFSIVHNVLLRPLPFDAPERIVTISEPGDGRRVAYTSPATFLDWKAEAGSFEEMAGYRRHHFSAIGPEGPERVQGYSVSPGFFRVFGVDAVLGRVFEPGEPEDEYVAVLDHAWWQGRYGGDPSVIGSTLVLNDRPHTIIGVMPEDFHYPRRSNLWVRSYRYGVPEPPFEFGTDVAQVRGLGYFQVVCRLPEGITKEQAGEEIESVNARLVEAHPDNNCNATAGVTAIDEVLFGDVRPVLLVLMMAVALVLMIACANVANLLLARALQREREIALRGALGAARSRIVRQLLTESLLLSLAGGVLGVLLAVWGTDFLVRMGPADIPRFEQVGINPSVLVFCLIASVLTGMLFGLLPSWTMARSNINTSLREGGPRHSESGARRRLREVLVGSEVALSLVLLVGAALMIRSLDRLQRVDPGFDTEGVAVASVNLPANRYPEEEQMAVFWQGLLDRARALPEVESAGLVLDLPVTGSSATLGFEIGGRPEPEPGQEETSYYQTVTPGYFTTMRVPILKGRDITPSDNEDAPGVIIINRAFADRHFPDEEPLGQRITYGDPENEDDWLTVVGVVGDIHQSSLREAPEPEVYVPMRQDPWYSSTLVVRTRGEPVSLLPVLGGLVQQVDPVQPVYGLAALEDIVAETLDGDRFLMLLMMVFAAAAAILATVGIYGVISYTVNQRTREIGIRMALGAARDTVFRLVVGQGMVPVLIGVGTGIPAALAAARLLADMVFEVGTADPVSFVLITLLVLAIASLSVLVPARRATRIQPTEALRHE